MKRYKRSLSALFCVRTSPASETQDRPYNKFLNLLSAQGADVKLKTIIKKTLIMLVLALFSAITFAGGPTCPIPSTNSVAHLTEGHLTAGSKQVINCGYYVSGCVQLTYPVDHNVAVFVEAHDEHGYVAGTSVTIYSGRTSSDYTICSDHIEKGKTYTMKISSAECAF